MRLTSKYSAQKKISILWFVASAIFIPIFLLISVPRTAAGSTENFEWLINYISPTLSLIASAFWKRMRIPWTVDHGKTSFDWFPE